MKTSTMVWTIIVVLVIIGLVWYFFSQESPSITTPPPSTTQTEQTGTNNTPATTTNSGQASSSTSVDTNTSVSVAPMQATVTYDGHSFSPATVTIAKGGTVTFNDTAGSMWLASDPHPIHNGYDGTTRSQHCAANYTGPAPFDECKTGSTFSFTFNKVGSWGYHDHLNDGAQGTVVVQ